MPSVRDVDAGKFAERLIELALILQPVVFIYFAGIIYLSKFLSIFGISIHEIDFSLPIVLSYSANVFFSSAIIIPIVILMLFIILFYLSIDSIYPSARNYIKAI
jgi:hypothetical protein